MNQMKKVMGAECNTEVRKDDHGKIMTTGSYSKKEVSMEAKKVSYSYESPNKGTHGLGGVE